MEGKNIEYHLGVKARESAIQSTNDLKATKKKGAMNKTSKNFKPPKVSPFDVNIYVKPPIYFNPNLQKECEKSDNNEMPFINNRQFHRGEADESPKSKDQLQSNSRNNTFYKTNYASSFRYQSCLTPAGVPEDFELNKHSA